MKLLLLTPPLLQPNTPYPATMHLMGFLKSVGADVEQRDLSIKVVRDILIEYGDETTEEILEFLGGPSPVEEKIEASAHIEALASCIRRKVDRNFGFSRYAEKLCTAVSRFSTLEKRVEKRGVMDAHLERRIDEAMKETSPDVVGVTCPFPGTLIGAFKTARYIKSSYPGVKVVLGGGYVSTELRQMKTRRPFEYFDSIIYDEGYAPLAAMLGIENAQVPAFIAPSYDGIDWDEYFDIVQNDNFVTGLWSSGKWVKLIMSRGCYWGKCAFCDVKLPYIGSFMMPDAKEIVDAVESLLALFPENPSQRNMALEGVHFVDEAMPPRLISKMCDEILSRGLQFEWWGNIRFDSAFTPALARKMASAGCICVTGGLECANDRLLKLMNKGITCASAEKVLENFFASGIAVHAYLMYDFPTQTRAEMRGAERYVKSLAARGLIQSVFWHRFALTVHSPIAREPERFSLRILPYKSDFAVNEIPYVPMKGKK